ncbi:hypothetical protein X755_32415 [Mesorhizobium sp. LNJC405B00]|nr:hypothetical protein X755_32415 [Mesorhizobium sp. LNJC405B00]
MFEGPARAGLPVICIETRHTKAFLKARVNKTDRNDARGMAQMMRVNLLRPVHVKTLTIQKRRALLTARNLLQASRLRTTSRLAAQLRPSVTGLDKSIPLLRHPIARVSLLYGVGATAAT